MNKSATLCSLASLVLAVSCATSPTERLDPASPPSGLGEVTRGGDVMEARPEGGMLSDVVGAPTAEVFAAAQAVYEELGIPTPGADTRLLIIANPSFAAPRRLADKRLSAFLGCGRGITGPNADSFRVTMNIHTSIAPEGDGSRLGTQIQATATNPRGTSNAVMLCTSTFALERRILAEVRARVTR